MYVPVPEVSANVRSTTWTVCWATVAVAETPATYSSAPEEVEGEATGTLASDEALAALREKLTGGS